MAESCASPLATNGLFAGLSTSELRDLSDRLRRRRYAKGQEIVAQGDPANGLFVVETGRVKITLLTPDGRELVLEEFGPGGVFGETNLLDDEPQWAGAVAAEDSILLTLGREDFVRFLEERPRVAIVLLATLSRKLRHTTQLVQGVAFLDVPARLARALLDLSEARGKASESGPNGPGKVTAMRVTQTELAGMIGTTRESVNRCLGYFESIGLIRVDRGQVTILQPDRLRQRIY